ncbi:RES domain-containing protein [Gluconacetobacter sacchari DSM 12717]|uniref:RES domain-containing protein n=2 Tax=Gluconacetobacter sacchari TaxID=92759 RepID=A0A7W4IHD9_9PROT|nr:HEPN-associated N-terminal domain-containing protein [Gluconacetobacter sacchari]MBB2162707.1 RES domain-containing protein [Gluconacetobacter sacchari]GBQ22076.1 RES domain-containing protein [Gluconacetobacter sacchari DSM 12717]
MDYDESDIQASYPEKFVCSDCFDDDHLKAFIDDNVRSRRCSYCGKRSRSKKIAAPIDGVIERMFEAISSRYGEAWASGCSWDNEDDRYINETQDTDDLLQEYVELSNDDSGELYQDILSAFPFWDWSSIEPWSATDAQVLQWGWDRFVNSVKFQRRFFFTRLEEAERDREDLDPSSMLVEFGRRCSNNGLIVKIPKGTEILRCRPRAAKAERFTKARELGPPPNRLAKQNRMSPAGIPMFYGSDDKNTTLAEMPDLPQLYAIGSFTTLRSLNVLDLTNVRAPSIFDMTDGSDYDWALFMSRFLKDFSSPIERDDRIHIDYVPTQVITEYLRDVKLGGGRVDGIKYRSARNKSGICYVLFIDEHGVEPNAGDLSAEQVENEQWRKPKIGYTLKLTGVTHHSRSSKRKILKNSTLDS